MTLRLHGLVAATHTPFFADGQLNLDIVEKQAEHLLQNGVYTIFLGGTTGENHSLSVAERLVLAQRWSEVARGSKLRLVVHVGSNCIVDARSLAAQAQSLGVQAIAALAPSYFKPESLESLVASCSEIARAAPETPFYYYDIPPLTGLRFSMPDFLELALEHIPTLAGVKFSNPDLMSYQKCLHTQEGRFDMPWGLDEYLLAALALGGKGAVGSTYNFAAPLYHRVIAAFERHDLVAARADQYCSVQIIGLLASYGFIAASKAVMGFLGIDVGPARLPLTNLQNEQRDSLRSSLEKLGFFSSHARMAYS
jgi:N-acetylneuraminate lyase